MNRERRKFTIGGFTFDAVNAIVMLVVFLVTFYPFIYVLNYSLSSSKALVGKLMLWPTGFNMDSYVVILKDGNIWHAAMISVIRCVVGPVLMIAVTGMVAFVLSQKQLVCSKFFRLLFFFSMYLSAGLIPGYIFMQMYGLTNNFLTYILPGMLSVYNMVLLKTYIESIPSALEEAVYIDGGNEFQCYWRVIFQVCKPVNAAVILFSIINHWNSYIDTQLYNSMNRQLFTLQYELYNVLNSTKASSIEEAKRMGMMDFGRINSQTVKMAITAVTVIPIACVYPFMQKYFVSGILLGSVKA